MQQRLPVHEWLAVIAFCLIMLALTALALFRVPTYHLEPSGSIHYLVAQQIEVTITGAVEHPGSFQMPTGSRVADLLERAKPLPEANLSKVNLNSKLRDGRTIKIPTVPMITIYLEGAVVQPGPVLVKKGTRMEDLRHSISFLEKADLAVLGKRRKLKEGEIICIPFEE